MTAGIDLYDGKKWQRLDQRSISMWNGSGWVKGRVRIFDGDKWHDIPGLQKTYTTTWEATWSEGYWGSDHSNIAHTHYNSLWRHDRLAQGDYQPFHDNFNKSIEHGMVGFDDANMRSQLAGSTILKTELYLHSLHWAYTSGGLAVIGTHNARGWQEYFSENWHGIIRVNYYKRDQGQWITLPNWVGEYIRDNKVAGITTSADNGSLKEYGIFAGLWDGWKKPKIRITYRK